MVHTSVSEDLVTNEVPRLYSSPPSSEPVSDVEIDKGIGASESERAMSVKKQKLED